MCSSQNCENKMSSDWSPLGSGRPDITTFFLRRLRSVIVLHISTFTASRGSDISPSKIPSVTVSCTRLCPWIPGSSAIVALDFSSVLGANILGTLFISSISSFNEAKHKWTVESFSTVFVSVTRNELIQFPR